MRVRRRMTATYEVLRQCGHPPWHTGSQVILLRLRSYPKHRAILTTGKTKYHKVNETTYVGRAMIGTLELWSVSLPIERGMIAYVSETRLEELRREHL